MRESITYTRNVETITLHGASEVTRVTDSHNGIWTKINDTEWQRENVQGEIRVTVYNGSEFHNIDIW